MNLEHDTPPADFNPVRFWLLTGGVIDVIGAAAIGLTWSGWESFSIISAMRSPAQA